MPSDKEKLIKNSNTPKKRGLRGLWHNIKKAVSTATQFIGKLFPSIPYLSPWLKTRRKLRTLARAKISDTATNKEPEYAVLNEISVSQKYDAIKQAIKHGNARFLRLVFKNGPRAPFTESIMKAFLANVANNGIRALMKTAYTESDRVQWERNSKLDETHKNLKYTHKNLKYINHEHYQHWLMYILAANGEWTFVKEQISAGRYKAFSYANIDKPENIYQMTRWFQKELSDDFKKPYKLPDYNHHHHTRNYPPKCSVFWLAISKGQTECLEKILEQGGNPLIVEIEPFLIKDFLHVSKNYIIDHLPICAAMEHSPEILNLLIKNILKNSENHAKTIGPHRCTMLNLITYLDARHPALEVAIIVVEAHYIRRYLNHIYVNQTDRAQGSTGVEVPASVELLLERDSQDIMGEEMIRAVSRFASKLHDALKEAVRNEDVELLGLLLTIPCKADKYIQAEDLLRNSELIKNHTKLKQRVETIFYRPPATTDTPMAKIQGPGAPQASAPTMPSSASFFHAPSSQEGDAVNVHGKTPPAYTA